MANIICEACANTRWRRDHEILAGERVEHPIHGLAIVWHSEPLLRTTLDGTEEIMPDQWHGQCAYCTSTVWTTGCPWASGPSELACAYCTSTVWTTGLGDLHKCQHLLETLEALSDEVDDLHQHVFATQSVAEGTTIALVEVTDAVTSILRELRALSEKARGRQDRSHGDH